MIRGNERSAAVWSVQALARRLELLPAAVSAQPSGRHLVACLVSNRRRGNDTAHHADTNAPGVILCRWEPELQLRRRRTGGHSTGPSRST